MARRILVGYDDSDEAAAGLRRAAALAASDRAQLTVVHVAVPPPTWVGIGLMALPLLEDVVASGEELVRRAVSELPDDLCVRWHLVTGAEATRGFGHHRCVSCALRNTLEAGGHDLLVVGTGLKPGRVARALLRRCPDRVLTAPFAEQPATAWTATAVRPSISVK
ncbi:MAG TPA: universal stress protein [Capillimicrobium sp.]|nr:universal stress protein [Capillimicrobium sp.]